MTGRATAGSAGLPGEGGGGGREGRREGGGGAGGPESCDGGGAEGGSEERGSHGNWEGSPNTAWAPAGKCEGSGPWVPRGVGEAEPRSLPTRAHALRGRTGRKGPLTHAKAGQGGEEKLITGRGGGFERPGSGIFRL